MQQDLARYILELHTAAESTHSAADRPLYRDYLAETAVMLAQVVTGADAAALLTLVQSHERTRGHTWLQGPEQKVVSDAWEAVVALVPGARATQ